MPKLPPPDTDPDPLDPRARPAGRLPRNLWVVSVTSFLMDVSSEMVLNVVPLFLANVLGTRTVVIGLIEGVAHAAASLLKVFSGVLSDRVRGRKWLAVSGYGVSALAKPGFLAANSWGLVAGVRWTDRVGKGIRTAPRDALLADSLDRSRRGFGFGLHRAADTLGAMLGLLVAAGVVWAAQRGAVGLDRGTFHRLVLISLAPGFLAVIALATGAREVRDGRGKKTVGPRITFRGLGRPFLAFLGIAALFNLGDFSDAFLVLRAQERGLSVFGVLLTLAAFNLVYAVVATPAGSFSDRVGRKRVLLGGWLLYSATALGFGLARSGTQVVVLYLSYGVYYGLTAGTARALVADLVPPELRGTAYGTYHAVLGLMDVPASLLAGLLWQGIGSWSGFGAGAPFLFGGGVALVATVLLAGFRVPAGAQPGGTGS